VNRKLASDVAILGDVPPALPVAQAFSVHPATLEVFERRSAQLRFAAASTP